MPNTLPINRLRINNRTVSILYQDKIVSGGEECDGVYYPHRNRIIIRKGLSQQDAVRTLFHEVFHAIYMGVEFEQLMKMLAKGLTKNALDREEVEEFIVTVMAEAVYTFVQENRRELAKLGAIWE